MKAMEEIMEKQTIHPPDGYKIVESGQIKRNDLIWNRVTKRWDSVWGFLDIMIGQPITDGTVAKTI